MVQEKKVALNVMRKNNMQKPNLTARENEYLVDIFNELGLEMKGLNNLTKQNITKDDKREQKIR